MKSVSRQCRKNLLHTINNSSFAIHATPLAPTEQKLIGRNQILSRRRCATSGRRSKPTRATEIVVPMHWAALARLRRLAGSLFDRAGSRPARHRLKTANSRGSRLGDTAALVRFVRRPHEGTRDREYPQ
jgi:hypothetical protein